LLITYINVFTGLVGFTKVLMPAFEDQLQYKEIGNTLGLTNCIMKRLFPLINILLITAISFLGVDIVYKIFAAQLGIVDKPEPII